MERYNQRRRGTFPNEEARVFAFHYARDQTPLNFHQLAACLCLLDVLEEEDEQEAITSSKTESTTHQPPDDGRSEDDPPSDIIQFQRSQLRAAARNRKFHWLCGSMGMIFVEVLVLNAVYGAVMQPACSKFSSDVCPLGTWCREAQGICMWSASWYEEMCMDFVEGDSWREFLVDPREDNTAVNQQPHDEQKQLALKTAYFKPRRIAADVKNERENDTLAVALEGYEEGDLPTMCYSCMRVTHEPDTFGGRLRRNSSSNSPSSSGQSRTASFDAKRIYVVTTGDGDADIANVKEFKSDAYLVIFASSMIVALATCRELGRPPL
ncbi:unnamed protein product [Amoebophrya sp. A25]|nr:unnamed protein product [Amoebophrya sp. A25]|eukprot:GSA25T00005318001.1